MSSRSAIAIAGGRQISAQLGHFGRGSQVRPRANPQDNQPEHDHRDRLAQFLHAGPLQGTVDQPGSLFPGASRAALELLLPVGTQAISTNFTTADTALSSAPTQQENIVVSPAAAS